MEREARVAMERVRGEHWCALRVGVAGEGDGGDESHLQADVLAQTACIKHSMMGCFTDHRLRSAAVLAQPAGDGDMPRRVEDRVQHLQRT